MPPAPALSRSPMKRGEVDESNQTYAVLRELGFMDEEIAAAMPKNTAQMEMVQAWPQKHKSPTFRILSNLAWQAIYTTLNGVCFANGI